MKKENMWQWVIVCLLVVIAVYVPFITWNAYFFPFITGKNFMFRILVEVLGAVWLLGMVRGVFPTPKKSPVLLALAGFLALASLSTISSVDPFRSFWSNFERMEGLVTYLHFGVYVLVLASVLRDRMWNILFASSIGASVGMAFFALYQLGGFAVINQGGARVDGTFGNAIYLAVYLLFHIFLTLLFLRRTFEQKDTQSLFVASGISLFSFFLFAYYVLVHSMNGVLATLLSLFLSGVIGFVARLLYRKSSVLMTRFFFLLVIAFQSVILLFTGTRGAILGLAAGIFVLAFLALFSKTVTRLEKKIAYGILGCGVLLVISFFVLRTMPSVTSHPVIGRIFTTSATDATVQGRLLIWGMAIEGAKEHPVLGWGLEGFRNVFDKYYNPKMYAQEQWFDRTHNILLDWLISGGILGLLAYLSLFGTLVWMLSKASQIQPGERMLLLGLLSAYFVHNLFVFDNIGSLILFGALIGYVHAQRIQTDESENYFGSPSIRIYGQFVAIGVGIVLVGVNLYQMNANNLLIHALQKAQQNPAQAIELFTKALQANSIGKIEAREQLIQFAIMAARANLPIETKQKIAKFAAAETISFTQEQPNDARTWLFTSLLWRQFGNFADGQTAIEKAVALSPKKQTLRTELVNALILQKKYDEAYVVAKETFELEKNFDHARIRFATAAIYAGKKAEAEAVLEERFGKEPVLEDEILSAYAETGNTQKVITLLLDAEKKSPLSRERQILISSLYFSQGKKNDAVLRLKKVAEQFPDIAKDIEGAIGEIQAGKNPFK